MRGFSTLGPNDVQDYEEHAWEDVPEDQKRQYKEIGRALSWEDRFQFLGIPLPSNNDPHLMEPRQFFPEAINMEGYTARDSEDVIALWERVLLGGDLNLRDRRYYRDNRLHMNAMQRLEYLRPDDYTNHPEFEGLQCKYGNKDNTDESENAD